MDPDQAVSAASAEPRLNADKAVQESDGDLVKDGSGLDVDAPAPAPAHYRIESGIGSVSSANTDLCSMADVLTWRCAAWQHLCTGRRTCLHCRQA
jgi:hypothetical protein